MLENAGRDFSVKQHEQVREGKFHFPHLQRDLAVSPSHLISCSVTLSLTVPISSIDSTNELCHKASVIPATLFFLFPSPQNRLQDIIYAAAILH